MEEKKMSFLDHLEVFRWHLIKSVICILIFTVVAFIFKNIVFDSILLAPKNPNFPTYKALCSLSCFLGLGDSLCFASSSFSLLNISMSGQFSAHIVTSIFVGIIISFPYILWQFWSFLKPGLHEHEIKLVRGIVFFSSLLFLFGILFGYYVIAPMSVNFLGSYQVSEAVSNQINLNSFISTVTTVTFANGVIFELPIVVYFLTKLGFLTPSLMRKYRKHGIIAILILSAIITPPDVISQILVSLPLMLLYEISIKISKRVVNNNDKQ